MSRQKLTDATIALICPQHTRWPTSGGEIAFARMKDAVTSMHGLARALEANCSEVEHDIDLNPGAVARRIAELGRKAVEELSSFPAMQKAQKAVQLNMELLQHKMKELPVAATDASGVLREQEIRSWIARQKSPIDAAVKGMSDPRVISAILAAPHFLSNLSEIEHQLIATRCRESLHPDQVAMEAALNKGMADLNEGVQAARRLILERTGCVEGSDGVYRSIREPQPKVNLTRSATSAARDASSAAG